MKHEGLNEKNGGNLSSWLDSIQQDSWQLELVVSGFVIFLLFTGWGPLQAFRHELIVLQQTSEVFSNAEFFYQMLRMAYLSLMMCLLVHLVLRGIWIAGIGLRSVSGEIDYGQFHYQPRFLQRLQQRTGSFDDYVQRLERWCSIFFSLAFLIVFCFLSLTSWGATMFIVSYVIRLAIGYEDVFAYTNSDVWISLIMTILGLIYLFDFVTLGWLKRVRWLSRPYYYLYCFMGWISLARLYRPLYYNLIDNRLGKRLAIAVPFLILGLLTAASVEKVDYAYMPGTLNDGKTWLYSGFYDEDENDLTKQLWLPSLTSKYVRDRYVELFVPYVPVNDDQTLKLIDSLLAPGLNTGLILNGAFNVGERNNPDASNPALLAAFEGLYKLYINDSLTTVSPLFRYHRKRKQGGTTYMIPAHDLPAGEHRLRLSRRVLRTDSVLYNEGYSIYFYK